MPAAFALDIENTLKEQLLRSCDTVGFERCTFTDACLAEVLAKTKLTREQALKWAENFRDRHAAHSRELKLLMKGHDKEVC